MKKLRLEVSSQSCDSCLASFNYSVESSMGYQLSPRFMSPLKLRGSLPVCFADRKLYMPSTFIKPSCKSVAIELSEPRRKEDELTSSYHESVRISMLKIGTRMEPPKDSTLSMLLSTTLDIILRTFSRWLTVVNLKREIDDRLHGKQIVLWNTQIGSV